MVTAEDRQQTAQRLRGLLDMEAAPDAGDGGVMDVVGRIRQRCRHCARSGVDDGQPRSRHRRPEALRPGRAECRRRPGARRWRRRGSARLGGMLPAAALLQRRLASFHLAIDGLVYSVESGSIHPTADTARATAPQGLAGGLPPLGRGAAEAGGARLRRQHHSCSRRPAAEDDVALAGTSMARCWPRCTPRWSIRPSPSWSSQGHRHLLLGIHLRGQRRRSPWPWPGWW